MGNLKAKRDWGYAKEYCEVMWKILQLKKPDDFVVATGSNYSVREFVEKVGKELKFDIIWKGKKYKEVGIDKKTNKILIKVDPDFYRPSDINLLGDSSKAKKILKWKPKTSIEKLIKVMIKKELSLIEQNKLY